MNQVQLPFKEVLPGRYINLAHVVSFSVVAEAMEDKKPSGRWLLIVETVNSRETYMTFIYDREQDAYRAIGINRSQIAMFS